MRAKASLSCLGLLVFSAFGVGAAHACTGFFVKAKDGAVIYARSLEFASELDSKFLVVPRDTSYTATMPKGAKGAAWRTRYGFTGMNMKGLPHVVDGLNEKGLQFGTFYFPGFAEYADYDPALASRSIAPWEVGAWVLGRFASVKELRKGLGNVRVVKVFNSQLEQVIPLHYFVVDASGDSIVFEPVDKVLKVYDNPVGAVTNAPAFDWHLTNLRNYVKLTPEEAKAIKLRDVTVSKIGNGSGMLGLPGDLTPPSRFIRAAYYSNALSPMETAKEALNKAMRLHQTFYIVKGMKRERGAGGPEYTQWEVYSDLKNMRFYFSTYENINMRMIQVGALDFSPGPIRALNINQPQVFQDLTAELK